MKIAASDYDGTLFRNNRISDETIKGVYDWRSAGHKFGMVSGRDYGMLVPQLNHYGIEYDFTICNNGGIIRDKDGTVLYQANIDSEILVDMSKESLVKQSLHFAFSARDVTYICHEFKGSWITHEAAEWDFPIVKINESDIAALKNIHQFSLGFEKPEQSMACSEVLNKKFGSVIHAYPNRASLDITPIAINKRQGIEQLIKSMHWNDIELYVIGDEINDLPMITAFKGYTVDTARDVIREKAQKIFSDVGAMLEYFI